MILSKPSTSRNTTSNVILGWIYTFPVNLEQTYNIIETYTNQDDPWSGILVAAAFVIFATTNRLKNYSTNRLVFGRAVIIPIRLTVDW